MGEHDPNIAIRGVQDLFDGATILENHVGTGHLKLQIPSENMHIGLVCSILFLPLILCPADIFRRLENSKERLGILSYSLSQTTLENIFIRFASQQDEERGDIAGLVRSE